MKLVGDPSEFDLSAASVKYKTQGESAKAFPPAFNLTTEGWLRVLLTPITLLI